MDAVGTTIDDRPSAETLPAQDSGARIVAARVFHRPARSAGLDSR